MSDSSHPEAAGGPEAAREVVACSKRTLAAPSVRIELYREFRCVQAKRPRPAGWRGDVLRLAGKATELLMDTGWRLTTRREVSGGLKLGQMVGEGIAEPARGRYMLNSGSFAQLHTGGKTFSGRSGRSVEAVHASPGGQQAGEVLWLLRLLLGTTDASLDGTETIRGTACRKLAVHADLERASNADGEGLQPPPVKRFEELRALPATVWIDGQHVRRVRFEQGSPARQISTLDLWEFGGPVGELDWSRLPTSGSPGNQQ